MKSLPVAALAVLITLAASPLLAAEKAADKKPATAKPAADDDVFRSAAARIELRKPKGWHLQSLESTLANRASVRMKDEEFKQAIETQGASPIFIAAKHEEPFETLNPTIQVLCRPIGPLAGKSGVEILTMVVPVLERQFEEFEVVKPVHEVPVGGQKAGRVTTRYTLRTQDDRTFRTEATIVTVPRGIVLYQLGFSGPHEGEDAVASAIDPFLAAVKFLE